MRIVCDSHIPFIVEAIRNAWPHVDICPLKPEEIDADAVQNADVLVVRTRTKVNEALLSGSTVKLVCTATIGFDHIDTHWCDTHGIRWTNAPGCNSESVAQYITSLLLTLAHRRGETLAGKTVGVIGVGNVGSKIARNARTLGMNVLLNDPPRARREGAAGFSDLETLRREADFITCHVPLNPVGEEDCTFHLADARFFAGLRKKPFFINSSRGEVCDNAALKQAIRTGQVNGAALDVWENEPEIDRELLGLLDFATPHIAGYSADGKANGTAMSILALVEFFGLGSRFDAAVLQRPPDPPEPRIDLMPYVRAGENETELLYRAVAASYAIESDDRRLRAAPADFEKLRGDYPLRREFDAFEVAAPHFPAEKLAKLRFRIRQEGEV